MINGEMINEVILVFQAWLKVLRTSIGEVIKLYKEVKTFSYENSQGLMWSLENYFLFLMLPWYSLGMTGMKSGQRRKDQLFLKEL